MIHFQMLYRHDVAMISEPVYLYVNQIETKMRESVASCICRKWIIKNLYETSIDDLFAINRATIMRSVYYCRSIFKSHKSLEQIYYLLFC